MDGIMEVGSLPGYCLIYYGAMVSALSIRRPVYDRSAIERTAYKSLVTLISFPALLWALVYAIGYGSILEGVFIWFVFMIFACIYIKILKFDSFAGVHLVLAGPALIVGIVLTIMTHPF